MESVQMSKSKGFFLTCSARHSHFGMVTDEMRFINEQQLRRMSFMPYKKRM